MMKEGQFIYDGSLDNIGMELEEFYLKNFEDDSEMDGQEE